MIEVLPIGTPVRLVLGLGEFEGIITALMVRHQGCITYECAWLHNGKRECEWFIPQELEPLFAPKSQQIGFKKPEGGTDAGN